MTVERPHEGSGVYPPKVDSLPEEPETSNTVEGPPGHSDSHPETTPEPMAIEPRTNSLAPTPDSEEVGAGKKAEPPQQPRAISGIVEVR